MPSIDDINRGIPIQAMPSGMPGPAPTLVLPHPLAPRFIPPSSSSSSISQPNDQQFLQPAFEQARGAAVPQLMTNLGFDPLEPNPPAPSNMLYAPPSYPPPHFYQAQQQPQVYQPTYINPPMTSSMSQWFPAGNHFSGAPSTQMPILPFTNFHFGVDPMMSEDEEGPY